MEELEQGHIYNPTDYREQLSYRGAPRSGLGHDRPRPASARDTGYGEMYDSGIHAHASSPRINQLYSDNPGLGLEERTVSLNRRGELYGTLRGNFDTLPDRMPTHPPLQNYAMKTLSSNPGLSGVLGPGNQPHRRSHSYDINLEKQGLADYNCLLAAAGIGANPVIYGNPSAQLLGYGGVTAPTLPNLSGIEYGPFTHRNLYPTLQQGSGIFNLPLTPDVTILQRECLRLQHELEVVREKLNTCTTSIRTFWSPELKRERAMRSEENAKYAILADHLHQLQLEKQTMLETLHNVEAELRRERDYRVRGRFSSDRDAQGVSELDILKKQVDELTLENRQLKKSVEEADRRTANVKASLTATEESLRRLIEAVKAGKAAASTTSGPPMSETGVPTTVTEVGASSHVRIDRIEADRAEIHRLRSQLNEACTRGSEAERQVVERNFELSRLKEEFDLLLQDHRQLKQENEAIRQDTRQTQTLQSLVDTKESKIMTLENEIRLLEDEVTRLRDDGLITPNTSTSSGIDDLDKTLQAFRSNERLLKSKVEMLNGEISKRDCEIYTLQSRLEMTDKQHQDQTHHINVLKEQVKTREHKISMLMADTEDFRKRLKEKETLLEKKTKNLSAIQTVKRQLENEILELKDQLDIKERKLSLMQRKIENLEDLLNDKDTQLAASKVQMSRIQTERFAVDTTHAAIDESLKEREKSLERLRELQQRVGSEAAEEQDANKRYISELRNRLETAQRELDEKSSQLLGVREELSEFRTSRLKHDAEISQMQTQLNQRASEVATLQMEKQMQHKRISMDYELKYAQRVGELEAQINQYMETNAKMQSEVDRLTRSLDNEKYDKERQLQELQDELRELQNNLTNLKRTQQTERKKQTQLLEETRQREENAHSDTEILKSVMNEKDARIRELEQALRESVRLTTEREIYASGRDDETRQLEQQIREMRSTQEQLQRERNNLSAQLASVQEELCDRESQLKTLEQECFQNYLPELEKLRRANHEANLRVAAMVKLTQGREHALTDQDRTVLAGIPLFPNIVSAGAWSTTLPGASKLYLPGYRSGGSTSPHMAGSAFQLFGNSANLTSGRASVPGQSIANPDVVMLTRMLQEKETTLQTYLHELTQLRFQNSEHEIRLRAMQRELDAKTTRLGILETSKYSTAHLLDMDAGSPTGLSSDFMILSKANRDLTMRCKRLQTELDEKERALRHTDHFQSSSLHGTDFSEMAVLRRELITVKAEKETEIIHLNNQLDQAKQEKMELTNELRDVRSVLSEKENQLRLREAEQDKEHMDRESLQKKYEVVLTQMSEKTEKLQKREMECEKSHVEEIKRQKTELDSLKHHITYLQNTIQERENRIELIEKESFKIRDELSDIRKQLGLAESEAKSLREEVTYREERSRQLQAQHTEELGRLRSAGQEYVTRISQLEMKLNEKEHELKSKASEMRCQSDEMCRLQSQFDEIKNRLNVSQKRVEERELRLRKLETENHDLLEEIHVLRKGNTELESQVDSLRQRLLDRQERPGSTVSPTVFTSPPTRPQHTSFGSVSSTVRDELEHLRKQYTELSSTHAQTQKQLDDLQIECDQSVVQRNTLRGQLEEEVAKRTKLEEQHLKELEQWKTQVRKADLSDQTRLDSIQLTEWRNQVERKDAQIACLTRELERHQSSSTLRDRMSDSTSQQLLVADLQVRLRQAIDERDQVREQLSLALMRTDTSFMETHQQLLLEKQTLQEQVANLTQTAHNATSEADRYQRESRQASSRVQQLSRQLQETQNNCDAIARQRDGLRDQLDQVRRNMGRSGSFGVSSVANLFGTGGTGSYGGSGGMRPASAGPVSYENVALYSTGGSASQLSRELDRLHRENENIQNKLQLAQNTERANQTELEQLRTALTESKEEVEREKKRVGEAQEEKNALQTELAKQQREAMEKAQIQQREQNDNFKWIQQQLKEKTQQVENVTTQLNNARQYCAELEQRMSEMSNRLKAAESQVQQHISEIQNQQQLCNECTMLRNNLKLRETEVQKLRAKLDQTTHELDDQSRNMEQMAIELSTVQAQVTQAKREVQEAREQYSRRPSLHTEKETDHETVNILKEEIKEAASARRQLENELDNLRIEIQKMNLQVKEKTERIDMLENTQLKQQKEEIESLHKELGAARAQITDLGGFAESGVSGKGSPLKLEIDSLKREIIKRDDTILKMERDCQEKHLRRIEALQAQIRRYEEEAANLSKVLDEQRAGLEERDNLIRQLRSNQNQASVIELEKLRVEHSRCKEQFQQYIKRINTLAEQIESQSDEILTIKLEALTASLCEKEANIALMELTAPKNVMSDQALEKLRTERDHLQIQQRQLANTRAMLEEERKSRR